jgi:hypothetical protein
MKLRHRRHYKAQEIFVTRLALSDGGSVTGGNWYWRKKCYRDMRRTYKRMGLYPASAGVSGTAGETKGGKTPMADS